MTLRAASLHLLPALAGPAVAMEGAIEKEVLVAATVDPVWDAWTTRAGFFSPGNAPPSLQATRQQRTFATLRFEPLGARTRVTRFHAGWGSSEGADGKPWDATCRYPGTAWTSVREKLQKRAAPGGQPIDWTARKARMKTTSAPHQGRRR